jgi:hypothetical protein
MAFLRDGAGAPDSRVARAPILILSTIRVATEDPGVISFSGNYVDPGYHRHRHAQPGYGYDTDPDARNMNYDVNRPPGFGDTGSQF